MAYVTWKLERYALTGTTWSSTPIEITEFYDVDVEMSLGDGRDSFSFKVNNFNDTLNNYYKDNDKILIYRAVNTATVLTSDILMAGTVKAPTYDSSSKQDVVRVKGYNYSESVMSAITFVDIQGKTVPEAIKQAINHVRTQNEQFSVTWDDTNPSVTSTGAAFPIIDEKFFNVPLLKVIEKLSAADKTNDGLYIWWVDNQNKFQWRHSSYGTNYSFNSASSRHRLLRTAVDTKEIINYVILRGGRDPAGKPLQVKVQDGYSISKYGQKYYFSASNINTAESLIRLDLPDNDGTDLYPSSYPFTTNWKRVSTGATITVSSDSEYNAAIRDEITDRLKLEANKIIQARSLGKRKIDITFIPGEVTWKIGDKISSTIPEIFKSVIVLRVKEAQYTSDLDSFSLEEDVGTQ